MEEDYVLCFDLEGEEWKTTRRRSKARDLVTSYKRRHGHKIWSSSMTPYAFFLEGMTPYAWSNELRQHMVYMAPQRFGKRRMGQGAIPMDSPIDLVMPLRMMRDAWSKVALLRLP
jgi:hypothetical protein